MEPQMNADKRGKSNHEAREGYEEKKYFNHIEKKEDSIRN